MNPTSSHQDVKDLIPAAALEILDADEARQVSAHLQTCPECSRMLDEYREAAATLPGVLPKRELRPERSESIRGRLLNRARDQHAGPARNAEAPATRRLRSARWTLWTGWAVAAGLAGILMVHHSVHRPVNYGWFTAGLLVLVLLALAVYARVQRGRTAALEDRLAALERQGTLRDEEIEPYTRLR